MTHSRSTRFLFTLALAAAPALLAAQGGDARAPRETGPRIAAASVTARLTPATHAPVPAPAPDRADGFASSGFAQFMSSPAGRVLRVVAGAAMIGGGIAADSKAGTTVAVVGAVPLLAGSFDFCVLSPLFGGPLRGRDIRAARKAK